MLWRYLYPADSSEAISPWQQKKSEATISRSLLHCSDLAPQFSPNIMNCRLNRNSDNPLGVIIFKVDKEADIEASVGHLGGVALFLVFVAGAQARRQRCG